MVALSSSFWLTVPEYAWSVILTLFDHPQFTHEVHILAIGVIAILWWAGVTKFIIALLYKISGIDNRRGGS